MEARLTRPIVEIVRFELEKNWSAFFTGLILMLLILGGPGSSAPHVCRRVLRDNLVQHGKL